MSLSRLCTAATNYLPPKKGPTPPPLPPSPTSKQACSPNEACGTTCSCPATAPHCVSPRGQTVGQCQAGVFGVPAPQKRARRFPSRLIPAGKASLILANYCNKPVWPALVRAAGLCVGACLGGCSRGRPGQSGVAGLPAGGRAPGQHLLVKSVLLQGRRPLCPRILSHVQNGQWATPGLAPVGTKTQGKRACVPVPVPVLIAQR